MAHLDLADDEQRVLAVAAQQRADVEVCLPYPRPRVVPAHDLLARCSMEIAIRARFGVCCARSSAEKPLIVIPSISEGQL